MEKYKLFEKIMDMHIILSNDREYKNPWKTIRGNIEKACGEERLMKQCALDFIQWAQDRWIDTAGRMVFFEETASKDTPSGYKAFSNYGGGGWLFEQCSFCQQPVYDFFLNYKVKNEKKCKVSKYDEYMPSFLKKSKPPNPISFSDEKDKLMHYVSDIMGLRGIGGCPKLKM